MAAGILSFTGQLAIKTNADFNFALTCTDSSTGNPIDFTGYNAKMSIGYYPPCNTCETSCPCTPTLTIVYTLTSEGMNPTITFPTPTSGVIQLNIPEEVTSTLPIVLTGNYDLLLLPPGGAVQEFLQGPIQILSGITTP
jgi:hypothetical protein